MKKIILLLLSAFILIVAFRGQAKITITGNVKDENANPVVASVRAGKAGTTADANGNYSIAVNEQDAYLVFSATGYQTQKVKIGKRTVINVIIKQRSSALQDSSLKEEEIVTTALGVTVEDKAWGYASAKRKVSGLYSPPAISQYNLRADQEYNTEEYSNIVENGFHKVSDDPLSTFSIDVDAASYSNVRRYLNSNQLPPAGAVRTEEMINYFKYQYPQPTGKDPFSINTEISDCPWNPDNKLVLIGLQGKNIPD